MKPMKKTAAFVVNGVRCSITMEVKSIQGNKLTVDLTPVPADAVDISFTGNLPGSMGQNDKRFREIGGDVPDLARLLDIWDSWHMPGLKAGTRAQNTYLAQVPEANGYDKAKAALREAGLDPDRNTRPGKPYEYGSAWLYDHPKESEIAEAAAIMDRLDGGTFGTAPDISEAPDVEGDIIDSRDVIARLEIYRAAIRAMGLPDDVTMETAPELDAPADAVEILEEYIALRELESDCAHMGDWSFGATLIRDSYFEDYARQYADDIGAIDGDARWPACHIDWDAAAQSLKSDFCRVTFKGDTYWIR